MRLAYLASLIAFGMAVPAFGAGHDYPGLGHIQGYEINIYSERGFDTRTFTTEEGQKIPVSGHVIEIRYLTTDSVSHASYMEIYLNYISVLKGLKAEMLRTPTKMNTDEEHLVARFYRNETPVYVDVHVIGDASAYDMVVVEQKAFKPSIVTSP
jgi:hypothetical protein